MDDIQKMRTGRTGGSEQAHAFSNGKRAPTVEELDAKLRGQLRKDLSAGNEDALKAAVQDPKRRGIALRVLLEALEYTFKPEERIGIRRILRQASESGDRETLVDTERAVKLFIAADPFMSGKKESPAPEISTEIKGMLALMLENVRKRL